MVSTHFTKNRFNVMCDDSHYERAKRSQSGLAKNCILAGSRNDAIKFSNHFGESLMTLKRHIGRLKGVHVQTAQQKEGCVCLISLPFEAHAVTVDSANCIAITKITNPGRAGKLNDVAVVLGQVFN